ncbi:MAG: hypothetical protein BGP01_05865 [Paludibacter sp. 47-17]|nr:MAG: hypothetical protein ABS72_03105 [Paludibacter sp. SCN 50-10]OJX88858.1 MAG: hypothetical protein BGP01_05865 [Paludibacter sp. 47-17]
MKLTFTTTSPSLILAAVKELATEAWQQEIVGFLEQWCDDRSFVELKTSGSTGEPKLIQMPKQIMLRSAQMTNAFFGLDESSVALLCLPASYIAGKMMVVRAIAGMYTLVAVKPSSNPFEEVASLKIDFTAITPYQLTHSYKTISSLSITNIIIGGSQVTPAMEGLIRDWPIAIYETFGMTETASHIAVRKLNGADKSEYFRALPGVGLSVDQRGCLEIVAPHLYTGTLVTNDLVELHDPDLFRWLGRYDRVVNSGGVKLFPEQIERKLHDLIELPFFISALPHPALGEQLVLVVEAGELSEEIQKELVASMKNRLGRYELPGRIICIPEFVYSTGNKVLRNETLKKRIGH